MDAAADLREQLIRSERARCLYNDLVVKACARALTKFPAINASWREDRIATHAEVHVGVAVAIPDGLIVPVVRNADRKSVVEISREVKDLAARARDKKLQAPRSSRARPSASRTSGCSTSRSSRRSSIRRRAPSWRWASVRKVPVVGGGRDPAGLPDEA